MKTKATSHKPPQPHSQKKKRKGERKNGKGKTQATSHKPPQPQATSHKPGATSHKPGATMINLVVALVAERKTQDARLLRPLGTA